MIVINPVFGSVIFAGHKRFLQFFQSMCFGHQHTVQNKTIIFAFCSVHFQQMPHGIMTAALAVIKYQFAMSVFIKVFCQMFIVGRTEQQKRFRLTTQRQINEVFSCTSAADRHHTQTAVRKIVFAPFLTLGIRIYQEMFHFTMLLFPSESPEWFSAE